MKVTESIVEFKDVSFSYDDVTVLDRASFSVHAGEFVAITGPNGSGKSTIAHMIDAYLLPDSGSVHVLGYNVLHIAGTDDVFNLRSKTGFVFQNPDDQLVASIVADEVAFGPSNLGVDHAELIERIDFALNAVDMAWAVGRDVNSLSGGERQRIAIAGALAMRPELLILDEPSSMLDVQGRRLLLEIIKKIHAQGVTVVLITHNSDEALAADRILTMCDSKVIELDKDEYKKQAELRCEDYARSISDLKRSVPLSEDNGPLIKVNNCSFTYDSNSLRAFNIFDSDPENNPVLENIDLSIYQDELLCITGANGAGKTTFIQLLNGILKPTSGTVEIDGISTATKDGADHARKKVGIVFQYPERALFADTIADDIAYGPRNQSLPADIVDKRVREAMMAVGLDYDQFANRSPYELSGGEQRKVAIAGVLSMKPDVLVLDEPCAGLDTRSHLQVIELLAKMRDKGQTIVLVSHDERDVHTLADRIFTLQKQM